MLYSEIFKSMQGEGYYTGRPSMWLRLFLCNLECRGFGQKDPTNPDTYELPFLNIDIENIKKIEDLPVFEKGCDSSYSWAKRFRHLNHNCTVEEVVSKIESLLPEQGVWNQDNGYVYHMIYTGGEPLLKPNQKNIRETLDIWKSRDYKHKPQMFTIETNGTQVLEESTSQLFCEVLNQDNGQLFISFSPKLFTVSGEPNKRAIIPQNIHKTIENINKYIDNFDYQLKFVLGPQDRQWEELENVIDQIGLGRSKVWIMPVGGTVEEQYLHAGDVADRAIELGYNVSARVHNYLWANEIGK